MISICTGQHQTRLSPIADGLRGSKRLETVRREPPNDYETVGSELGDSTHLDQLDPRAALASLELDPARVRQLRQQTARLGLRHAQRPTERPQPANDALGNRPTPPTMFLGATRPQED